MQKWQALGDKFDLLSQRERGLIAVAVFVLLGMSIYLPLEANIVGYVKARAEIKQIEQENGYSVQQLELYQQRLELDPNNDIRQQLTAIADQVEAIDEQLSFQMVDMVPAKYMPRLLSGLLAQIKGLELKKFESLPPTALLKVGDEDRMNLYSHGIKLVFAGDYFSVLKFVKAVEAMPDKLYWKSIDYRVGEYPLSEVEIDLYTLSINEEFISVAD